MAVGITLLPTGFSFTVQQIVKALLMTYISRRTVLQPRCWVVHPFYSGVKLFSFLSVSSSLLDHMVACSSVGTIHFPF